MRRRIMWLAAAVIVLVVVGAWAIDSSGDDAPRGVELAGEAVGGKSERDVALAVARVASAVEAGSVEVRTPDGTLEVRASEIGLHIDQARSVRAVMRAGETAALLLRPFDWLRRLVSPEPVDLVIEVDEALLSTLVAARDPTDREPATEPTFAVEDGRLVAKAGEPGRGLDAEEVARAIEDAATAGRALVVVEVRSTRLRPRFSRADAEALLQRANELTADGIEVSAGVRTAHVGAPSLRSWLRTESSGEDLELAVDAEVSAAALAQLLPDAGSSPIDASIVIQDGRPVVEPGQEGTGCSAPEAANEILQALTSGSSDPIVLPLASKPPSRSATDLERLGIKELIGSFTTRHPARQSRVVNIHRIADLVRGVVIDPGARFSVNEHVGRRTTEKGFVSGGVIEAGVFAESVGGGVSQFATTLFNAAFFGGLDILESQSHSLYISRYPYGREATLSFPKPDLVLRNGSPSGVLIWTEYTGTSITVTLWSTVHAPGEQTAQIVTPAGNCTRVRTERTRIYPDGTSKVDAFTSTYRPAEGAGC